MQGRRTRHVDLWWVGGVCSIGWEEWMGIMVCSGNFIFHWFSIMSCFHLFVLLFSLSLSMYIYIYYFILIYISSILLFWREISNPDSQSHVPNSFSMMALQKNWDCVFSYQLIMTFLYLEKDYFLSFWLFNSFWFLKVVTSPPVLPTAT